MPLHRPGKGRIKSSTAARPIAKNEAELQGGIMTGGRERRIPSLDGWRALAIILVLASHWWASRNLPSLAWIGPLAHQGDLGVRIFFVLSGYLITRLIIAEYDRTGQFSLKDFYIRRSLRILPVYYLYLLILFGLQAAGLYHDTATSWLGALTFTRNVLGSGLSATGHLWSLAIEEQFYLVWPITFAALNLKTRWRLAVAILVGVAVLAFASRMVGCSGTGFVCQRVLGEKSVIKYADTLAIGCLAAVLEANRIKSFSAVTSTWLFHLGVLGLIGTALAGRRTGLEHSLLVSTQSILTMVAILGSTRADASPLFRMFNARWAVGLGALSYSLYVWHMIFLAHFVGDGLGSVWFYDWRVWWFPSILAAAVSYTFYERPFLRLKSRLSGGSGPARRGSSPASS